MRIAVVGAGAMGSLFGGRLAESGHEVMLVAANDRQIEALNAAGLRLETDDGDRRVKVQARRAAAVEGQFDLIVVFTKGMHTRTAVQSVAHLVGPATWALTLQNGLGNAETIAAVVPAARIAMGVTNIPADRICADHVRSHGGGSVRIGTMSGAPDPAIERIRRALDEAGLPCGADASILAAIWEKVAFNAAMNSLAALTRLRVGALGDHADGRALASAVVEESLAVARASGIAVDPGRVHAAIAHGFREHRAHAPSMLQDVLAGRATEIESINGAIVAAAEAAGVAVPVTQTLLRLVRLAESAR
jgi:2-dehydropantoate 2-reductase